MDLKKYGTGRINLLGQLMYETDFLLHEKQNLLT
jgi:hypothetical protein